MMWTNEKLSLRDGSMSIFSRFSVWVVFFSITLVVWRVGFMEMGAERNFADIIVTIVNLAFIYFIAVSSPNRVVVETAAYVFSVLRNRQPTVEFYIPNGFEKEPEDEMKRIYRFRW